MSCNPYFNLNSTTADLEANILSMGDMFDQESNSAKLYDSAFLVSAIATLKDLAKVVKAYPDVYQYPMFIDRINAGPISQTEYADFLVNTGTTQNMVETIKVTDTLSVAAIQYLENVDTYYTDNFSSSTDSFCSIFSRVLTSITNIFNQANSTMSGILNIGNLINSLIDTLKSKLLNLVNQLVNQINSCLGSLKGIVNTVQEVSDFFSDLNIQTLKDTVNNVIASAASKFMDITPANVEYLIYRFCQLSNAVEQFMRNPLSALQSALKNCTDIKTVITNNSYEFTARAIAAGAFRMSDETINGLKAGLGADLNANSEQGELGEKGQATPSTYWSKPLTAEEYSIAAAIKSAPAEQLKSSSHPGSQWFDFSTIGGSMDNPTPAIGVKGLQPETLVMGMRIATRLGVRLQINSGYRSPEYNASIGGAKHSLHMSGLALDCRRAAYGTDFASGENFIKIASQEGAEGIGTYSTFIHIDRRTGGKSTWTEASGQMAHLTSLAMHKANQFRDGSQSQAEQIASETMAAINAQ